MDGYLFYYSGSKTGEKKYGVGIAIAKRLKMEVEPHYVSDRMMWIQVKHGKGKYVIFSVYAPTEPHNIATKQAFYDQLQQQVKLIPRGYEIILMGDWNARIGKDINIWNDIRGRFGGSEMGIGCNENGLLLQQFCTRNQLWIANTSFRKPKYATWTHARTKREFTLDYCIVAKGLMRHVQNCGIERWMDCDTDHTAVKMALNVKTTWKATADVGRKKKIKGVDYKELVTNREACKVIGTTISENLAKEVAEMKEGEAITLKRIMDMIHTTCSATLPEAKKREVLCLP